MVLMSAFQAEDGGSIPPTRSREVKNLDFPKFFSFWVGGIEGRELNTSERVFCV